MRFDMACLRLMSYWLAALYTFIRAISVRVFQISYFGIGPTEVRLGLALYCFSILAIGPLAVTTRYGALSPLDGIAVVIFAVVFISFLSMVWSESRRIARLEPIPVETSAPAAWTARVPADGEATP